jgi:hypothetical protein
MTNTWQFTWLITSCIIHSLSLCAVLLPRHYDLEGYVTGKQEIMMSRWGVCPMQKVADIRKPHVTSYRGTRRGVVHAPISTFVARVRVFL